LKSKLQLVIEDVQIQVDAAKASIRAEYPFTALAELNGASMFLEEALRIVGPSPPLPYTVDYGQRQPTQGELDSDRNYGFVSKFKPIGMAGDI
jgi:hypothetical protein